MTVVTSDRAMTLKSGAVISALCAALVGLISFFAAHGIGRISDHETRIRVSEAQIMLLMENRAEVAKKLDQIDLKLDKIMEAQKPR